MIDTVGILYSKGEYDEEGNTITAPLAKPGYHVNALSPIQDCDAYRIDTPDTPNRVYAGVTPEQMFFYTFPDETTWDSLDPRPKEDINNA